MILAATSSNFFSGKGTTHFDPGPERETSRLATGRTRCEPGRLVLRPPPSFALQSGEFPFSVD